jgi:hypothetical protein
VIPLPERVSTGWPRGGPVAITDDDLFEVLDWAANGILDDFPPPSAMPCWRYWNTYHLGASGPPER